MVRSERLTLWDMRERDRAWRRVVAIPLMLLDVLLVAPLLYLPLAMPFLLGLLLGAYVDEAHAYLYGLAALLFAIAATATLIALRTPHLPEVVLGALGAVPLPEDQFPDAWTALELMTISSGLRPRATLWLIDSSAVNALCVGWSGDTRIAVTRGLLSAADPCALTGVMADLIARLASGDVYAEVLTLAALTTVLPVDAQPGQGLPGRRKRAEYSLERADVDAQFLLGDETSLPRALRLLEGHDNTLGAASALVAPLFIAWPGLVDAAFIGDHVMRRLQRLETVRHGPSEAVRIHA